jgi:hypothetical protein
MDIETIDDLDPEIMTMTSDEIRQRKRLIENDVVTCANFRITRQNSNTGSNYEVGNTAHQARIRGTARENKGKSRQNQAQ